MEKSKQFPKLEHLKVPQIRRNIPSKFLFIWSILMLVISFMLFDSGHGFVAIIFCFGSGFIFAMFLNDRLIGMHNDLVTELVSICNVFVDTLNDVFEVLHSKTEDK